MATWRSTAETSEVAFKILLDQCISLQKNREQCTKSPIGAPRMSKLGRMDDFTAIGNKELPFLLNN